MSSELDVMRQLAPVQQRQDFHQWARCTGPSSVRFYGASDDTQAVNLCGASAGDTVLVLVMANGSCAIVGGGSGEQPQWATIYGGTALSLSTSRKFVPLGNMAGSANCSDYFEPLADGVKCLKAGELQLHALIFLGIGFVAADIVHLRFAKNPSETATGNIGGDVTIKMHNDSGGTIQNFAYTTVAAGDIIKLGTWNSSGARGSLTASNVNRINIRYI